jgi:hypothetical protein
MVQICTITVVAFLILVRVWFWGRIVVYVLRHEGTRTMQLTAGVIALILVVLVIAYLLLG